MTRLSISFTLAAALLVPGAAAQTVSTALPTGTWTLFRTAKEGEAGTVQRRPAPTVRFEGARVGGTTGCNTYSGGFTRSGANLRFGPLAATRRACTSAVANALETRFLASLAKVRRFGVTRDFLVLSTTDRETLTFRRTP